METEIKAFRINSSSVSIEKFDWSRGKKIVEGLDTAFVKCIHCVRVQVSMYFGGGNLGLGTFVESNRKRNAPDRVCVQFFWQKM